MLPGVQLLPGFSPLPSFTRACADMLGVDTRSLTCTHAGLLKLLEEKEAKAGIIPDADLARLMDGISDGGAATTVPLTLQLLSLTNCADTIVGDAMTRGVSGGERKRVTSGEVMVGPCKVLLMDEISTGALPPSLLFGTGWIPCL